MLKTCVDSGAWILFFEGEFENMVRQVEAMADALSLREPKPLDNEATPFTMDLGIVHPRFFIASKCRN